jgi:hypothetical protein
MTSSSLNVHLLCDALVAQTRRLERIMKECGFEDRYIRASTEYELSLANRIKLELELEAKR